MRATLQLPVELVVKGEGTAWTKVTRKGDVEEQRA